ncbi:MAG: hypothetical protein R2752_14305 [Vicinamibacterales bacterium]
MLVVGSNSGAIAKELAPTHETWMAGQDVGEIPHDVVRRLRLAPVRLTLRGVFHRVPTVSTLLGRRVRAKMLHGSGLLIRTKRRHLAASRA